MRQGEGTGNESDRSRPQITMMDTRAGALTDGGRTGADLLVLRDAAGHLDAATSNRHLRSREANIGQVVTMRNTP